MGEAPDPADEPPRDLAPDPAAEVEVEVEVEPSDAAVPFEPIDAEGDGAAMIARARQRHGVAGGLLAAGMFGVDQVLNGRKPREEAPVVVASSSEPVDVDADGITVPLDDESGLAVVAPPQPRTPPRSAPTGKRRRWR